ncbi:EAL domain-containing protein [Deinococcus sp. A31D244]|uniref:EAL domain-containing protein n=1 Tax=Deinococcus sp. A31D244 TaxID=3397675 RepID=UPI0039DF3534
MLTFDELVLSAYIAAKAGNILPAVQLIADHPRNVTMHASKLHFLRGIHEKYIGNQVTSRIEFDKAREISIIEGDLDVYSTSLVQIAQILHLKLDNDQAIKILTEAAKIRDKNGDRGGKARAICNIANIYISTNNVFSAIKSINDAKEIYNEISQEGEDRELYLIISNNLSRLFISQGKYDDAIHEMRTGLVQISHESESSISFATKVNISDLMVKMNRPGEAIEIIDEILNENCISRVPQIEIMANINKSIAILMIDKNSDVSSLIISATNAAKKSGDLNSMIDILNLIASIHLTKRDNIAAISVARESLELAESGGRKQAQVEALQLLADASEGSDPVAAVGYLRRLMAVQAELHEAARDRQLQELTAQAELESARRRVEYEQELRAQAEETIQHQLQELERGRLYDHLTDLPNRVLLHAQLAQRVSRSGGKFLLVSLDLNRFQLVNDTYGHDAADELLRVMGVRAAGLVESDEMVARVGGDEFALILLGDSLPERLSAVLAALSEPVVLGEERVRVSWSAGAAYWPGDSQDAESLRQASELALSDAKTQGESVVFFDASLHLHAGLEGPLSRALQRGEFELHFQPLVDVSGRRVVCAEALLRWNSPEHGLQMPGTFMPILERSDAIVEVGAWVLREACRAAALWGGVRVAVNLSARQFASRDLRSVVLGALRDSGLPPACLELEITESLMMQSPERAARLLAAFQEDGVRVVLDDFGTGYSSLGYLARFPLSGLKIDRSFVSALEEKPDGHDAAIVRAVVGLSRDMGLELVAEGVESLGQVELLENLGVRIMQGYYFARPSAQWRPLNVPGVR